LKDPLYVVTSDDPVEEVPTEETVVSRVEEEEVVDELAVNDWVDWVVDELALGVRVVE